MSIIENQKFRIAELKEELRLAKKCRRRLVAEDVDKAIVGYSNDIAGYIDLYCTGEYSPIAIGMKLIRALRKLRGRVCLKCKRMKHRTSYYEQCDNDDGLMGKCIECKSDYSAGRYTLNQLIEKTKSEFSSYRECEGCGKKKNMKGKSLLCKACREEVDSL